MTEHKCHQPSCVECGKPAEYNRLDGVDDGCTFWKSVCWEHADEFARSLADFEFLTANGEDR